MEKEERIIIKLEQNWADEFDVVTVAIVDAEEWREYREYLEENEEDLDCYEDWFGTNECIRYWELDDFLYGVTEIKIPSGATSEFLDQISGGPLEIWPWKE